MTIKIAIGLAVLVALAGGAQSMTSPVMQRGLEQEGPLAPEVRAQQMAAYNEGGIPDAAKVTGRFAQRLVPEGRPGPDNLRHLSKLSHVIIRGTVESTTTGLSKDRRTIHTIYKVRTTETLKGETQESIDLRVPGGQLKFEDAVAIQVVPGFNRLRADAEYVLYLRRSESGGYEPTSGPLGVYCLSLVSVRYVNAAGLIATSNLGRDISRRRLTPPAFLEFARESARN